MPWLVGLGLFGHGPFNGLSDPPQDAGRKLRSFSGIKTLDGLQYPEVAFADQVQQRQSDLFVFPGDSDYQGQARLDHNLPGPPVALFDPGGQLNLRLWL